MFEPSKKTLVYLLILILAFSSLYVIPPFRMLLVEETSFPLQVILFPFKEIRKLVLFHVTYNQYRRFQKENEILKKEILNQEEILNENNRFRALLAFKQTLSYSSVAANVIGRDPTNWNAAIIIDRGSRQRVKKGFPVVTALGVVGKVIDTGPNRSKVLLLNDPNFSVPAITQRTRESGLVAGTLEGLSYLRYLSPEADVKPGDQVITSKISTSFPEGLLIGSIVSVNESPSSPTIECLIEPAAPLSQIEEVIVIIK